LQENFDATHTTLNRVEQMLQPEMRRGRVRYCLSAGVYSTVRIRPNRALPLFKEAWELGQAAGETRLIFDALHMIAIAQTTPDLRVEWNLKGIEAIEQTPSKARWLLAFYNNLGEAYAQNQDFENALKAFRDLARLDTGCWKIRRSAHAKGYRENAPQAREGGRGARHPEAASMRIWKENPSPIRGSTRRWQSVFLSTVMNRREAVVCARLRCAENNPLGDQKRTCPSSSV